MNTRSFNIRRCSRSRSASHRLAVASPIALAPSIKVSQFNAGSIFFANSISRRWASVSSFDVGSSTRTSVAVMRSGQFDPLAAAVLFRRTLWVSNLIIGSVSSVYYKRLDSVVSGSKSTIP